MTATPRQAMERQMPKRKSLHRALALAVATLTGACGGHRPRSTALLFPSPVTVLGHRGARAEAPENTLAAFGVAARQGLGFELDVTLCGTGEVVVIHDDTLERTTDGQGFVDETPLADLRRLDAGGHFGPTWAGERLPLLSEVLAAHGSDVVVNIEIKSPRDKSTRTDLARAVVGVIEGAGVEKRVLVSSFDPFVLEEVRLANPSIARGQITSTFEGEDLRPVEKLVLRRMWLNGHSKPDVVVAENVLLQRRTVARRHRQGYRVFAWTVDDPVEIDRLIGIGVDGIITDHPGETAEQVRRRLGR